MSKPPSGQTAFGAAATRLIEQYQPPATRLFNDPVVKHLTNPSVAFFFRSGFMRHWFVGMFDKNVKGVFGGLLCRTKYIDEKYLAVAGSVQQAIILGAGMDTRPYRLDSMKDKEVFEVDLQYVQDFKKQKIKDRFGSLPTNVHYIPIDFNTQQLEDVLRKNHFDFSKPTFIIWEGVTQYITQQAVEQTFSFISKMPKGSFVVFTYIIKSVIDGASNVKGAKELMNFFRKRGSRWLFGFNINEVEPFLRKYNLQLLEDVDATYYEQKYLQPLNRQLDVSEIERSVFVKIN